MYPKSVDTKLMPSEIEQRCSERNQRLRPEPYPARQFIKKVEEEKTKWIALG